VSSTSRFRESPCFPARAAGRMSGLAFPYARGPGQTRGPGFVSRSSHFHQCRRSRSGQGFSDFLSHLRACCWPSAPEQIKHLFHLPRLLAKVWSQLVEGGQHHVVNPPLELLKKNVTRDMSRASIFLCGASTVPVRRGVGQARKRACNLRRHVSARTCACGLRDVQGWKRGRLAAVEYSKIL